MLKDFVNSMKTNIKTVVGCVGGLVAGAFSVHADYPGHSGLWRRLTGGFLRYTSGGDYIGKVESVIPGAYKELVAAWKKVEDKDGMLPENEKKKMKLNLL